MLCHDRVLHPPNVQLLFTDGKNVLYVCTRLAESKIQESVVSFGSVWFKCLYGCSLWTDKPTGVKQHGVDCLGQVTMKLRRNLKPRFSVTHWFLSYRASVSDTPYLVGCNGVRRLGIISLVTSNVSSET